jgi:hypothetical protein
MKWAFISIFVASQAAFAQVADQKNTPASEERIVKVLSLRMSFPEKEKYRLKLYNYDGDQLLWSHEDESQGEGELFMIDPQPYVQYGLRKFQLFVLNKENKKVDSIYFRVDPNGNVVKE